MRNIYKDEKDLLLVIEKEKRVSLFKNTEKNGLTEFWEDEITCILRTHMGSRRTDGMACAYNVKLD